MFRHPSSYLPSYLLRQTSLGLHCVFAARGPLRLILVPLAGLVCFGLWYALAMMAALDFILRPRRLVSLALCYVLVLAFLAPLMIAGAHAASGARGRNGQGNQSQSGGSSTPHGRQGAPPRPIEGSPGVGLPDTDEVLRRPRHTKPIVQPAIPSVQRRYRHPDFQTEQPSVEHVTLKERLRSQPRRPTLAQDDLRRARAIRPAI